MNDIFTWLAQYWVVVAGVLVAVVVFTWMVARRMPSNATETIGVALQAATVARELVMAAKQLWIKGDLPKDERFNWVYAQLQAKFPDMSSDDIVATIEAAVFWLKQMTRSAS